MGGADGNLLLYSNRTRKVIFRTTFMDENGEPLYRQRPVSAADRVSEDWEPVEDFVDA
jgi:hypothetical protein